MKTIDTIITFIAFGAVFSFLWSLGARITDWQWWAIAAVMLAYSLWQYADGLRSGIEIGRR